MKNLILLVTTITALALAMLFSTVSQAVVPTPGTTPPNKKYTYVVKTSTYAPNSLQLTGIGNSWIFSISGGTATFKVNNGETISLPQEMTLGNDFNFNTINPSISLIDLQEGATVLMFIDGGN